MKIISSTNISFTEFILRLLLILGMFLSGPSYAQQPMFQDLIKQPGYKDAWARLIKSRTFERKDSWIPRWNGVVGPVEPVVVAGERWLKADGCQPRNCQDNSVVALANPRTTEIWVAHRRIEHPSRRATIKFYGNPSAGTRSTLASFFGPT